MNIKDLQHYLKITNRYTGALDGLWGRLTEAAILTMLTDGPDTSLTDKDFVDSAARLGCAVSAIRAVCAVEANGAGFFEDRPKILPEPHRFSKWTGHKFDKSNPTVSYRSWGDRPYPKTQDLRYDQLLKMIRLDVEGGFACASYGKFQIMGENYKMCGYTSPVLFAEAMARDEKTQLRAFENFVMAQPAMLKAIRNKDWKTFARLYNGSGYAKNQYDVKLAQADKKFA
jgi:hypothetical protein